MQNTLKRKILALAAVLLLSVPSAIGVQHALAPTRGEIAGWLAAGGFELVYLSTAVLIMTSDLRRYAARVALAAVAAAVLLNTIADYGTRVPGGLTSSSSFVVHFDSLALGLSLIESLPLAGLAYAMATLLHRLAETETPTQVRTPVPALAQSSAETTARDVVRLVSTETTKAYACPACGHALSLGQYGSAKRYGYCAACRK